MKRMGFLHISQDVKRSHFACLNAQIFKESGRILSRVKLIRGEKRKSGRTLTGFVKNLTIPIDLFLRVIHQDGE
jgi:hypothetical protein